MDFLSANNAFIDLNDQSINIQGIKLKAEVLKAGKRTVSVARVLLKTKLRIPPRSSVHIMGKLDNTLEGGVMVQPSRSIKGLLSPYSIANQKEADVPILLQNMSAHRIILPKNHVLGTATPFEGVMDDHLHVHGLSEDDSTECKTSRQLPNYMLDLEKRSVENLSQSEAHRVHNLLIEFQDVFAANDMDIGLFKGITHKVNTGDAQAVRAKLRRTPLGFEKEEETHLKKLLENGVIVPSKSEWASAPVLVRKKDGTVRYCVDFRKVNSLTKKDAFPLPNIEECMDTLSGNVFLSTLDMAQGYYQIEVDPHDRHKLAFITKYGLFEFVRMPFGTCNSPATFQRMIQLVLHGLNWKECLAYLDDVIVLGNSFDNHLTNLKAVLSRFRKHNLKLKPKKCCMFRKEIQFLGRVVSEKGVSLTPESMKSVAEWPIPNNRKEVETFLGYMNYHREHLKDFAVLAAPLYDLTKSKSTFLWGEAQNNSFHFSISKARLFIHIGYRCIESCGGCSLVTGSK